MTKTTFAAAATAAALALASFLPAAHAAVTVEQTLILEEDGQDLVFDFAGLPTDATMATITVSSGIATLDDAAFDGLDLDDAGEFFDLTVDGVSQGQFNCTGTGGATAIPGAAEADSPDCDFTLTLMLEGSDLASFLADGMLSIIVAFSDEVNDFSEGDQVIVGLALMGADAVPLPAAAFLFVPAMAGLGFARRRA